MQNPKLFRGLGTIQIAPDHNVALIACIGFGWMPLRCLEKDSMMLLTRIR